MSTYRSESREASVSESNARKRGGRPPFKLCFSRDRQPGRSNVSTSKNDGNLTAIKAYSRESEEAREVDVAEALEQIRKEERKDPREIHRWPLLTSHTYGWWHGKGIPVKDPRLNFHRKTSELVNFQMKIYAEDRKLGTPKR